MTAISWNSSSSGSWTQAADWTGGTVPGSGDDVTIAAGSAVTVTVNAAGIASNSLTTSASTLSVTAGVLTVGSNAVFNGAYTQSGGTANFGGSGASFASGLTETGGVLNVTGSKFLSSSQLTEAGGVLNIRGSNGGTLAGATSLSSGTIALLSGQLVSTNSYAQTGGMLKISGAGAVFAAGFSETGGTIALQGATLTLEGNNDSIGGTVSGTGSLVVNGGVTTLGAGATITLPRIVVQQGTLALNNGFTDAQVFSVGQSGHVSLGGNTLTLSGRALLGGELGGGITNATGTGRLLNGLVIDNNAVLNIEGVFTQSGNIQVGATLDIAAGGSLTLTGNDAIGNTQSLGTLTNAGLLAKTGGGGVADITTSFSSPGSISVGVGTIDFDGLNNNFSGAIGGAGHVSFGVSNQVQGTTDTFAQGMTLSTGSALIGGSSTTVFLEERLAYGGAWQENGGTLYLDGALSLTGTNSVAAFDGGLIKGAGTLTATGLVNLGGIDFEGDTHSTLTSQVIQSSAITLGAQSGSAPTLTIAAGATMMLEGAANIFGADGSLINAGVTTKAGGASDIVVQGTLTNTGTLIVQAGTLSSTGAAVLGGTVSGIGVLELAGGTTLNSGLALSVGQVLISEPNNAAVTLAGSLSYVGLFSQHGGTLALAGNTLKLTGGVSLDGGTLTSVGTLSSAQAVTIGNYTVGGQATLALAKGGEQTSDITLQAASQLTIAKAGTYTLDDSMNIAGTGTLTVNGGLAANGLGLSTISPNVVANGTIRAGNGELSFLGGVTGSGTITAAGSGQIDFGQQSSVAATVHVNLAKGDTSLLLENAPAFSGLIGGFVAGDFIEISGLQSGVINQSWNPGDTAITLSDSQNHTFTLDFSTSQSPSLITVGIGPHGYIGIGHT